MGGNATQTGGWVPSGRGSVQTSGAPSSSKAPAQPPPQPDSGGQSRPAPSSKGPAGGGGGGGSYADTKNPKESLKEPVPMPGMKLENAIKEAGWQVIAVDWVLKKFGLNLMEMPIKYISGDYEKISKSANAWENVGFACQDIRNNINEGWMQLEPHWTDKGSEAMQGRIQKKWTLALEAEAKLAQIIGRGFGVVATGSKMAAKEILRLIKMGVNKAIEAGVALAIPVVGWARAVLIIKDVIDILWAIKSIIEGVVQIINGFRQMWQGIQEIGSALSMLDDSRNLNDAINNTNAAGRGARDVSRGASSVKAGANAVYSGARGVRDGANSAIDNTHTLNKERKGDVYYGHNEATGQPYKAGDKDADGNTVKPQGYTGRHAQPGADDGKSEWDKNYHSGDNYSAWRGRAVDASKPTTGTAGPDDAYGTPWAPASTTDQEKHDDQERRRETEVDAQEGG